MMVNIRGLDLHDHDSQKGKNLSKSKQQWRTQRVVAEVQDGHLRESLLSLLEAHVELGSFIVYVFILFVASCMK